MHHFHIAYKNLGPKGHYVVKEILTERQMTKSVGKNDASRMRRDCSLLRYCPFSYPFGCKDTNSL